MKAVSLSRTKIVAIVAGAALLVSALALPSAANYAYANNHNDSSYSSWINYNSVSYTDAREKTDATSAWDSCYSGPNHKVEVFATGWSWNPQYVGSEAYYFGAGASSYLSNYVYENGYPRALLWFSEPNYSGTISGVWSPDSV